MLVSGFVDGKLIYILEFPFIYQGFIQNLEKQIKRWEGKLKGSKTMKGQFLRSATFDYRHYKDCPNLRIIYLIPKADLAKYKDFIARGFYRWLEGRAK